MGGLKVFIADDHRLVRKGLVELLRTFSRVGLVKEADNGRSLLNLIKEDIPDVVILDIEMPVMDGLAACEWLCDNYQEVKIIMLSMHDELRNVHQAINSGAHAFLNKNMNPEELEEAIYSVADSGLYRNQIMIDALRIQFGQNFSNKLIIKGSSPLFSNRELSILKLLCEQQTNKQIAFQLGLSENTIRNHRVRMIRKADCKNSLGLILFALENGYSH